MKLDETAALITWLGQYDARIQVTHATRDIWHHSLSSFEFDECKQAILEHARYNENIVATPAAIRARASQIVARREAQQRAIDPPVREKTEADYRRKIRETPAFMAAFEAGRREGNADRAYATVLRETGNRQAAYAAKDRILRGEAEAA